MRIVFFSHYFPPEGNAPASRTYEHCVRWAEAGHDVTVITCAPNVPNGVVYDGYKNRFWPHREVIDGVDVLRVWTFVAPNSGGWRRILNYVSYMISSVFAYLFLCRRPNVVISTSPQFFCGWAGLIASWVKWTPFILEVRDIWPESIVTVGAMKKGMVVRALEWLERVMYLGADHIVAVGNGYKKNILSKVDVNYQITVVTNGVDPEAFVPQSKDRTYFETYGVEGKFICSYVGTIGMAHGLEVAIEAAKVLKKQHRNDIAFCLIGDGARRAELEQLADEADVKGWVYFLGRLPKSEMPNVLANSDCLLVHLKGTDLFQTVIPSKIFETMAMQRPLIMGVRGESAEIVRQSKSGIDIEPDNGLDLANAVVKLCDDSDLYNSMCIHGRTFVSENYSRDVLARRFLNTIESIANHEPQP